MTYAILLMALYTGNECLQLEKVRVLSMLQSALVVL